MRVGIVIAVAFVTLPVWAAPDRKPPTPRERAAYGMLLNLRDLQAARQKMPSLSDGRCPTGSATVTWGVAKTDPWDHVFLVRCTGTTAVIGSAGPDGKPDTADDLWSDQPLVDHASACTAACARARACKADKLAEPLCAASCATLSDEAAFYADTCTLLDGCEAATDCLSSALRGTSGMVSCDDFGRIASRAVHKPAAAKALVAECERDLLRSTELPCIAASSHAAELARCFLTVNRDNVEAILTR